jgi:hypothetical protein
MRFDLRVIYLLQNITIFREKFALLFRHFLKGFGALVLQKQGRETNEKFCETAAIAKRNKPFPQKPLSGSMKSTVASLFCYCFTKRSVFCCSNKIREIETRSRISLFRKLAKHAVIKNPCDNADNKLYAV